MKKAFNYKRLALLFVPLALANSKVLGHVQFVEEKVSGKISWRKRKIADILDTAQKGDNIIVSELSRLGRSMLECQISRQ